MYDNCHVQFEDDKELPLPSTCPLLYSLGLSFGVVTTASVVPFQPNRVRGKAGNPPHPPPPFQGEGPRIWLVQPLQAKAGWGCGMNPTSWLYPEGTPQGSSLGLGQKEWQVSGRFESEVLRQGVTVAASSHSDLIPLQLCSPHRPLSGPFSACAPAISPAGVPLSLPPLHRALPHCRLLQRTFLIPLMDFCIVEASQHRKSLLKPLSQAQAPGHPTWKVP